VLSPDQHVVVVAAVIARGTDVLICQRPTHKHHGGLWEFPGGKTHQGESLAAALKRELSEELAVPTVHVGEPLYQAVDITAGVEVVFIPAEIQGEPEAREHSSIVWCAREDLLSYSLAPSDRRFAEFYTSGEP
jgi:8-oxo-dGTP diphosphatase